MTERIVPGRQHHPIASKMATFDAAAGFYIVVAVITLLIVFATIWAWLSTRRN